MGFSAKTRPVTKPMLVICISAFQSPHFGTGALAALYNKYEKQWHYYSAMCKLTKHTISLFTTFPSSRFPFVVVRPSICFFIPQIPVGGIFSPLFFLLCLSQIFLYTIIPSLLLSSSFSATCVSDLFGNLSSFILTMYQATAYV